MNNAEKYFVEEDDAGYYIPMECCFCHKAYGTGFLYLYSPCDIKNLECVRNCQLMELWDRTSYCFLCHFCLGKLEQCSKSVFYMNLTRDVIGNGLPNHCLLCSRPRLAKILHIKEDSFKYRILNRMTKCLLPNVDIPVCTACDEVLSDLEELHEKYCYNNSTHKAKLSRSSQVPDDATTGKYSSSLGKMEYIFPFSPGPTEDPLMNLPSDITPRAVFRNDYGLDTIHKDNNTKSFKADSLAQMNAVGFPSLNAVNKNSVISSRTHPVEKPLVDLAYKSVNEYHASEIHINNETKPPQNYSECVSTQLNPELILSEYTLNNDIFTFNIDPMECRSLSVTNSLEDPLRCMPRALLIDDFSENPNNSNTNDFLNSITENLAHKSVNEYDASEINIYNETDLSQNHRECLSPPNPARILNEYKLNNDVFTFNTGIMECASFSMTSSPEDPLCCNTNNVLNNLEENLVDKGINECTAGEIHITNAPSNLNQAFQQLQLDQLIESMQKLSLENKFSSHLSEENYDTQGDTLKIDLPKNKESHFVNKQQMLKNGVPTDNSH